ncbi:MAG TPA: EAL domain-containing protein [Rhodopila sp.]|nr:EAL domain-containing protein [Rhodopila sp.]
MSIRTKILAGCAVLTLLMALLGAYSHRTERRLGALSVDVYDNAFMGVSYLRSAQVGFVGLRKTDAITRADISSVLDDLAVARDRAMSPEGRAAAASLAQAVAALTAPGAGPVSPQTVEGIRTQFEGAVEVFADDGFRYRRDVTKLVAGLARQTSIVILTLICGALIVSFLLTRLIAPPVRKAVAIAQAIAGGTLDNAIEVRGHGETADLLRALSILQDSIRKALDRIQKLMEQQASHHANELAEQHSRLEAALNNMSQGLCLFSPTGHLVVANQRFGDMFGSPRPDATADVVLRDAGLGLLTESIAQRSAVALTCELPDGRSIAVSQQPIGDGGWVVTYEDISERRRVEERMAHLARHDPLTGLPNRLLFTEQMQASLGRARHNDRVALLYLDLDRFKSVNDILGHATGDALLIAVADRIRQCIRDVDLAARLGGDEFVIIQEKANQLADTAALAGRIVQALNRPFDLAGQEVAIGVSIGIAVSNAGTNERSDALLQRADLALYRAKQDGRGTFRFFEQEMDETMLRRRALERDLRRALAEKHLHVFYQPLVQAQGVAGFEALLRWQHPERGLVSPVQFIPIAEECGLIGSIGAWVLEQACIDAAGWPGHLKVAVNLSPAQFHGRSLVDDVDRALTMSGLPPSRLELEITESILMQDGEAVLETLHALRNRGIRIAMDDFGTGYSSLSYLRRFPFDKIKIDQSFVSGIVEREECRSIVRAVIGLGRSLHIAVNAEGVETEHQLQALRSEGCQEIQGYLFSKPQPASEVSGLIERLGNATLPAEPLANVESSAA